MTTVGLIGSGRIGGTVAKLAGLASKLGPLARAGTGPEAAEGGDLVVLTIPLRAFRAVDPGPLAGKVVMDTCNYYSQRDGQIAELGGGALTSSELIQRHLAQSAVVKVFNNIFFKHLESLSRPSGATDRSYLPIAGDDSGAKAAVTAFLDSIGYGAVDAGPLAESWRQQPGTPVYGAPYGPFSDEKGSPASADAIREALAAAGR
jgi:8-hydroxy-5-deazaflavin:NADPH oxidoreductase